ncbi:ORF6N domain-containing protein [Fulvivirga sp. M361]|uniref:ORF6N domain-containing protein n=1 Tax=Fulvivirga sp. M361 TaxID=2594266 RepID=UPI00117B5924|nr:ORF6N domain-containing protein [Fulvivirga sp. M361]TRX46296.1 ORF6N domain-containing protein [Fulvivirga sp. M361]
MSEVSIPDEVIMNKIYSIRGHKVMLDRDLAELYGVETRALKQAVRRNKKRFPDDFMFEMNQEEFEHWRSHFVISKEDRKGLRYSPFCFTEQGLTMLSCVLNSDQAIEMNIRVVRIFTQMRQLLLTHKDLLIKVNDLEAKVSNQGKSIKQIFAYLKELLKEQDHPRDPIGFKTKGKKD